MEGISAIEKIQTETRSTLSHFIGARDSVALLDYPNHFNAGDTLIFRGTLAYLDELGVRADYVCAVHTYDKDILAQRCPDGPILLQGGGNFGDRYAKFQLFREQVIADHPHRTIVQLPQSMEFRDRDALRRTQELYSQHPDLHVLMRDHRGYRRALELFPSNSVHYCPDLAFGAGALAASAEPDRDVVLLKRRDRESVHQVADIPEELRSAAYRTDWHASVADNFRWWPATLAGMAAHKVPRLRARVYPWMRQSFDRQAEIIISNAIAILSRGRVVVTDRLHAAVLGILLGKPVVIVDNSNKKISAAFEDYLGQAPNVFLAEDFGHAATIARSITC